MACLPWHDKIFADKICICAVELPWFSLFQELMKVVYGFDLQIWRSEPVGSHQACPGESGKLSPMQTNQESQGTGQLFNSKASRTDQIELNK